MALSARVWEPLCALASAEARALKLHSWNVLADGLAQHGGFSHVSAAVLEWSHRWPLITAQIRRVDADIVCLYEMNHVEALMTTFSEYACLYVPKIASAALKMGFPPDGIAVLVRRSVFDVLACHIVYYTAAATSEVDNQNAIVAVLRDRRTERLLMVAATHLKAKSDPGNAEIRARQMQQLLAEMDRVAERYGPLPRIICGDWNARPHEPAYTAMFEHSANFVSTYNSAAKSGASSAAEYARSEPAFTTFKHREGVGLKKHTIDYVCVAPAGVLDICSRLCLPTSEEVGDAGLPNEAYPSDHLDLAVELRWK